MKKICLLACIAALPLFADEASHTGFYLSGALGFGNMNFEEEYDGETIKSNGGYLLENDLKIGGSVIQNLAVHGTLISTSLNNFDVKYEGETLLKSVDIDAYIFGAGVTYYLPLNFFVSSSLGMGWLQDPDDDNNSTDPGFGLQLAGGKEWLLNSSWGLGVALSLTHISAKYEEATFSATNLGVLFSATFN